MVFASVSADLIDPDFIFLDAEATGTVIHAIVGPAGTFLVSDQSRNVAHEYTVDGSYLGIFAPAGGANTNFMQNVRGIAL